VKRFARLYPLHALTLVVSLGVLVVRGGSVDGPLLVQNALLVHNVGLPPNRWAFNFPSWSISVEWCCALAFFALARGIRSGRTLVLALLAIAVGVSVAGIALMDADPAANMHGANLGLMRGAGGFAVGVLAYLASRSPRFSGVFRLRPAVILGATYLALAFFGGAGRSTGPFYLACFVTVGGLSLAPGPLRLLATRPLVWLGAISYSTYLLHMPLYQALELVGGSLVRGAGKFVVIAAILAVSHACYRGFEMPAQRVLRRWLSRGTRACCDATAEERLHEEAASR
jgi:peptidoglycan/LPS O-acetylase OafA/YrhL